MPRIAIVLSFAALAALFLWMRTGAAPRASLRPGAARGEADGADHARRKPGNVARRDAPDDAGATAASGPADDMRDCGAGATSAGAPGESEVTVAIAGPDWVFRHVLVERPIIRRRELVDGEWRDVVSDDPAAWSPLPCVGLRFESGVALRVWWARPGRYRVRLGQTPVVLREFAVEDRPVRLSVDLARATEQQFVVRLLGGLGADGLVLHAGWATVARRRTPVEGAAQFVVALPGDREIEFAVRHHLGRDVESVRLVRASGRPVELQLEPRTLLRFRSGDPVAGFSVGRDGRNFYDRPVSVFGDGLAVPLEPGRYFVRFEFAGRQPIRREVVVPYGGLDLGDLLPQR